MMGNHQIWKLLISKMIVKVKGDKLVSNLEKIWMH
jgi:hypothetical protein